MARGSHRVSSDLFLILTSLMIAFVVWVIAKGGNLGQLRFSVPINLQNLPENFEARIAPDTSEGQIVVTLPNSLRSQLQANYFTVDVDWTKLPGTPRLWCGIDDFRSSAPFKVGSENVQFSATMPESLKRRLQERGVQITLVEPEWVTVDAMYVTRPAEVVFRTKGEVAAGYRLSGPITANVVRTIRLTASPMRLRELNPEPGGAVRVQTDEIDLTGRSESFVVAVSMILPDRVFLVERAEGEVEASVKIEAITTTRSVAGVPIRIASNEKTLQVSHQPDAVEVRVRGPEAVLSKLAPSDLVARPSDLLQGYDGLETVVALTADFAETMSSESRQGLTVVSVSPTTATVKFRQRSPDYIWHGR